MFYSLGRAVPLRTQLNFFCPPMILDSLLNPPHRGPSSETDLFRCSSSSDLPPVTFPLGWSKIFLSFCDGRKLTLPVVPLKTSVPFYFFFSLRETTLTVGVDSCSSSSFFDLSLGNDVVLGLLGVRRFLLATLSCTFFGAGLVFPILPVYPVC